MHRVLSDGRLVCGWCGAQQRVYGRQPALADVRSADIDLYRNNETGVVYLAAVLGDGRTIPHYCQRIPAEYLS